MVNVNDSVAYLPATLDGSNRSLVQTNEPRGVILGARTIQISSRRMAGETSEGAYVKRQATIRAGAVM